MLYLFRQVAPRATGNMADIATKGIRESKFEYRITIDPDIAPYSVYTQIPWYETSNYIINSTKHPDWNWKKASFLWDKDATLPKKNPNEGWIDRAVLRIVKRISKRFNGTYE